MAEYIVSSGEISSGIVLNNTDFMSVLDSGTANNTTVSRGSMFVSSGGIATSTTVNGGRLDVYSGGAANSTTVNSMGSMFVSSGGAATEIVENGGYVSVDNGANVTFAPNTFTGLVLSRASATVHSGTTATSTTVNTNGSMWVFSGGIAENNMIRGGSLTVFSGGSADDTTVNATGKLYISSGGMANRTTVSSGGYLYISSGGTANDTIVDYLGRFYVGKEGVANNTTLYDGTMYVSGIANGIQLNIGERESHYYDSQVSSMGALFVSSGGTANDITINSGAKVYVSNRGTVNGVTANSGGTFYISRSGTATGVVENGGYVYVNEDADVTFTPNNFSGVTLSNALATVHTGTTANGTIVSSGGSMHVSSGGAAAHTTINFCGCLYVSSGGTATCTTVNSTGMGGALSRMNGLGVLGGTATDTTVNSGGFMIVTLNGTANNTTVNSRGSMSVEGGTATATTVNSSGYLEVFSGGTVNSTTINSGGIMRINYGGTITGQMVFDDGALVFISEGAILDFNISELTPEAGARVNNLAIIQGTPSYTLTVSDTQAYGAYTLAEGAAKFKSTITVQNTLGETLGTLTVGGKLDTDDRRYTLNLTDESLTLTCYALSIGPVIENETVTVSGYEIIRDATVLSGGRLHILDGGLADSTTINASGRIYISSGGIADHTTVNSNGSMYILHGGTANSATADTGACIRISSGATATAIVENGGYVYVANSATVSFVENTFSGCVLSRASATVHSGTTAIDATVKDWAFLYVSSGGIVNSATIDVDGIISVLGGTVNSVTVNEYGSMYIRDGGAADGTVIGGGCLFVFSGCTATNIVWTPCEGYVNVYEGGYVTFASEYSGVYFGAGNTLLSSASAMDGSILDDSFEMYVMNGGTADSTTVNYDGSLYVRDGGTAKNTEVNEGGTFVVSSGGTANSTTVNGGGMIIEDSGTADSITVNGGEFQVSAGGTAANIMLASGGELYVYYGGVATGIVENGGYVDFEDDESVSFVSNSFSGLVLSEASATVHSGTTANSATVNEYGSLRVHSGGIVNSTTVNEYGSLRVYSGGTADSTTVNGGEFEVSEGGMANGATVNCGGSMYVSAGGTATGILENGGYVEVDGGATVTFLSNTLSGLVLNYGRYATVHTSTTATGATLDFNGGLYVRGGQADHTTVNGGGKFTVSDDGRADSTTVNDGGSMIVADRGKAAGIAIHAGGNLEVGSGGSASDATVNDGGSAIVGDGGKATGITIHAGGSLEVGSGGSANDTTVNDGANMFVASNGTAADITVYAGGRLELGFGGTIQSAAILSGGIFTGHVDCRGITFDPGAELQFDLSVISPGNESALVNLAGLAEMQDCPSFTLPVSDSQDYGDYKLAENAWGFEQKTISVSNSIADFGSLSLDQSVVVGNREYSLDLNGGDLILSVNATQPTQYVYLDFDGENLARYSNPDLELSFDLSVADPAFSDEQRAAVVSALSERYGKYNIAFTLERPEDIEFSTLYFGVSSAFDEYGDFFGIAETCDGNDQVRDDNAFVLLDSGYSDEQILSVASHMLDHIMGFFWSGSVDGSPAILKYAESKALLSLSAGWDQEDPYNKYCPIYPVTGERCVVGCTNTAASQIIYYWIQNGLLDFTLSLTDSDAYQSNRYIMIDSSDHPESGHLSFAETNNLLQSFNILDENCIAALCFAAGVVQQADYTSDETATPWNEDLFVRAGFEKDEAAEQHESGMSSYYDVLAYELLHGRPVGVSVRSQRHAIVADGYDSSRNMFHLDFGWGDETTRWYTVEEMDALRLYEGIYGYTPVASPDLTIEDLSTGKDPVEWKEDVTLTFTVSNDGKEMSEETMAYVYCGDAILGACGIAYISPGYSRDFICTVNTASLKVGENILTVKVDSQNDEGTISAASVTITCMNGDVIPQTRTWEEIAGATQYVVEYSTDDFEHVVQFNADTNALDSYQLPEGNYHVRVKPDDGEEWTVIEPVVAGEVTDDPKLVRSNADGNADAFFVNAVGTWGNGYAAQHVSSADDPWGGTKERVVLVGKNKLIDVIEGSTTDANVLLMTDDANGDALFVDDIYSASRDELGLSQSRIAQIDEIRAGAGDDIVDMTSNKFEYTGDGMTIRGGDGDDAIWANKGDNFLFGDAGNDRIVGASGNDVIAGGIGNDRMHGGGGNDVFTFCDNWGMDTVEQLAGGSVTLWFASGNMENWNAETLTYTDGDNSVKVSGITADKITLKFGDAGSDQFATLSGMGAFFDATSERIFEGILASL